jgi:hypothetical protein
VPSFRVIVPVGRLRPGVSAESVLPAAAAAAGERTVVEASSVDVVAREARITVRFMADTVDEAIGVAEHTVDTVERLAQTGTWQLTQRVGGRWFRRA